MLRCLRVQEPRAVWKAPTYRDRGVSVCSFSLEVQGIAEMPASSHLLLGQRRGKRASKGKVSAVQPPSPTLLAFDSMIRFGLVQLLEAVLKQTSVLTGSLFGVLISTNISK